MGQIARPESDYSVSDWYNSDAGGSDFFDFINDVTPDDSSGYVYGEYYSKETTLGCGDVYTPHSYSFKLDSNIVNPYTKSGHKLRIRSYGYLHTETGSITCYPNVYVRITQGAPSPSNTVFSDTVDYQIGSWNTYEYTLTTTQANLITDYSDLYVEFYVPTTVTTPSGPTLGTRTVHLRITQLELDAPIQSYDLSDSFPLTIIGSTSLSGCSPAYGDITSTDWHFPEYLSFLANNSGSFSFTSGNVCQAVSSGIWQNINGANGDADETYAYKLLDEFSSDTSNYLQFKNYQFSGVIPSGSQIVGIQAKLYKTRWKELGGTPDLCKDVVVQLNYGESTDITCGACSSGLPGTWTIDSVWSNGSCSQCTGISGLQTLYYTSGCEWATTGTINCVGTLPKWKLEYNGSWTLTAGSSITYLPESSFNCTGNNVFAKNTDLPNCNEPTGVLLTYGTGVASQNNNCSGCSYINLIGENKSGAWASGSSTDPWPFGSAGEFIYGTSGDDWDYSLTEDIVKDCSFGISVLGEKDTGVFQSGITLGLDAALLKVWYRPVTSTCPYFPLYISGSISGADGFFPLYTSGSTPSGDFPLFIEGNQPISGGFPFYTSGNYDQTSGTFPLVTLGANSQTGSLNLYLYNDSSEGKSGSFPLFTYGATGTDLFKSFPLYTSGDNGLSGSINLYINSEGSQPTGSINLFISGAYGAVNESFPLFIESFGQTGIFPLFTLGSGSLVNGYPASGSINLYLHRPPLAEASLPLFINANSISGGFPMCITGIGSASGGFPMVIPSAIGAPTGRFPLYTHGF